MLAAQRHDAILAAVRSHGTVRLRDLADELGVTPVTVRRDVTRLADRGLVVRVHGGVAMPRRDRESTAPAARSPMGALAVRAVVGMVAPSAEYYWPAVIQGAQAAAVAAGGRLVLRTATYAPVDIRRQCQRLLDLGVQTLLVAPTVTARGGTELMRWLGQLAVPVVLVERTPPPELSTLALDGVVTDHALGAGLAVRHLARLGHRRIGLVACRGNPTTPAVRTGWAHAVAELDLEREVPDVDVPVYGTRGWVTEVDQVLLRCCSERMPALLVHSDWEAIGVLERARELGIDIPGEIAIVSYDDEVAAAAVPPITAVRPDKHRLGALAMELALARLEAGPGRPVHRISLWPQVIVRESCGQESAASATDVR